MTSGDTRASMEDQALIRRQKLISLKRKRDGKTDLGNWKPQENEQEALPKPLFRSYKPLDENLQKNVVTDIKPEDISLQVKTQLDAAKSEIVMDQLDVTSLAPRKPDWDLKRDITKKMEKLERRTHRAIAELIRDRLKEGKEDLATMVNATVKNLE